MLVLPCPRFFGCSAPVAVSGRDSAARIPFSTVRCEFTPLPIPSQMLLKWMEELFCLQQMWGCTEPPWKYQLMRLRGETVTFCTLWVTILVKPHQERGIARKLSPSMLCEAGVKLSEWPQQQLNGKLALLKWKEYYGLGGIRTWGWDLWLKTLSVYLSFPLVPGLLLFWNREFLVALTTTPAKASNFHLALGSFSFFN